MPLGSCAITFITAVLETSRWHCLHSHLLVVVSQCVDTSGVCSTSRVLNQLPKSDTEGVTETSGVREACSMREWEEKRGGLKLC